MVFVWELFFLGSRLTAVIPRTSGEDPLAARVEVVWLIARALFITPAIVAGAAFAYRIWF
jgi:cytochrome c biogenesis factor